MGAIPSAICGIAIGLLYGIAGYASSLLAERFANFTAIVFGGMLVRMTLALAAVVFFVSVMSVRTAPFFLSLLAAFAGAQAIEIYLLHRRASKAEMSQSKSGIIDNT